MQTEATTKSFALALYRIYVAIGFWEDDLDFKDVEEQLCRYIKAYIDFDGKLPYNGFDGASYAAKMMGMKIENVFDDSDLHMFKVQDSILMELTRTWMELSGVVDATYKTH